MILKKFEKEKFHFQEKVVYITNFNFLNLSFFADSILEIPVNQRNNKLS